MVAREKKIRWNLLFLALLWLASPAFSSQAYTFVDDTQHIHQLDTIPIPDQRTNGEKKIDSNLPSAGIPTVNSPITYSDPSTLEWIMKKIAGPDFKWEHVYRGLAFGLVGGIIVVGIGVLLVQAGLVAVTVVAVGAVVSILAAVAYSVITGDNGFVWWKAVGISVISGLGVITWSLMAAKAAILWEKIQIGFTWAIQRLAVTHLGQKLTALLGMIGTFFTTRLPAMLRSFGGILKNLFSFLWGMGQKFIFFLSGAEQKSFISIWNLIKAALINLGKLWAQGRLLWYTFLSRQILVERLMGGFTGLLFYLIETPEPTLQGALLAILSGIVLDGLLSGVLSNVLSKVGKTYLGQWLQNATNTLKQRIQSGLKALRQQFARSRSKSGRVSTEGMSNKTGRLELSDFTVEILETKPKYARIPKKWYAKGGRISIDENGVWTYTNKNGVSISYPNGFPDFSKYYHPDVKPVKIQYAQPKNYPKDYEAANTEAGLSKTSNPPVPEKNKPPEGYTWHHMEDGETMVLVEKDIHDEFKHIGGQSIVNRIGGD